MTGADNSWTADVMKIFRGELNCFNTDNIDLRLLESSCLIIWAETSQSDLECEKQLKDNCINFTKNMFNKCPLQSNEAVNINVTVKCSELFQGTKTLICLPLNALVIKLIFEFSIRVFHQFIYTIFVFIYKIYF